jgi:DNA polymerase (family 10)
MRARAWTVPVHNAEIAEIFETLADLLAVRGDNPFRIRAYRNAARTIRGNSRSMAELLAEGRDLSELRNIGKDLAGKIATIVETGRLPLLDELSSRTPKALSELMKIEGLGPKRVKVLYEKLRVRSLADLERALRRGRVRELPGFGPKTEQMISERLERFAAREQRWKLIDAEDVAEPLVRYLRDISGVKQVEVAGSYRRRKETVGDLDLLVTAAGSSPVIERFVKYDEVAEIVSQGKTRSTVRLRSGLQVDLRVVPQVSYGAALYYFTGSKAHNIAVRRIAAGRKLKLNEYGLFRGDQRIAGRTEQQLVKALRLPLIPPELREDRGEIEAARRGRLPRLVTLDDIRGDLHCHSRATDGQDSVEGMARAAKERGYDYVSINDHSRHVTVAHGLDRKRLLAQLRQIDRLNGRLRGIVVLKSIELDILEDGSLDFPDELLAELDFTVCAVHYRFDLPKKKQTERILRAMDNRYFNILAHPTGRLINEREPYAIDLERIMQAARERGCILELNAHPDRLDLDAAACQMAKDKGVKIAVSTDAHRAEDLRLMRFGIDQARRGWLEAGDVINTRKLNDLRKLLART